MAHPLTSKRVFLLSYALAWIIIFLIQTGVLNYFYELTAFQSFTDSLVVNLLHASFGLAIWYPVRFNPLTSGNFFSPLLNILATGVLTIGAWVGLAYLVLKSLFAADPDYLNFLEKSIPNRIIIDFLMFSLLVLVYSLIVFASNLKEKLSSEVNLKTMVREAELNMLKSQINPHFLFNSLNSISHLITKDQENARDMIIKLSDFLRFSLRYSEDENIRLMEELENMERYLQIEKIRFGDKLQYTSSMDPKAGDCRIPNMILQPLLENAIKHGVYESTEPISIEMRVIRSGHYLKISLSNDYDSEGIPRKGAGIGLKNISNRLELIYGRTDLLEYSGKDGIFRVELMIPQKHSN